MTELKAALEKAVNQKVTASSEEPHPTIAVLPFVNMSGDKEQEYFSEGLAEEIINALTQISGLQVIARTSAFAFKGKDQDITKIAEALRVSNILEGSVRKSGNRIRVTAQLIEASKGIHLWSERYDRELTDVFTIQDEISQAITQKLKARLSGDRHSVKRPTENIEAHNLNLKGRYYLFKLTPDGLAKSKEYFEQAIAMDPNYASPWHGLAAMYGTSGIMGFTPPWTVVEKSRRAILKALELDNNLPEAHAHLGGMRVFEFDWRGAEREFLQALELSRSSVDVWFLYSMYYLVPMGRLEEALAAMQKAQELDPLSPSIHANLGNICNLMGQYDRAIEHCRNALELAPHHFASHVYIGSAHMFKGEFEEGIRSIEAAVKLAGQFPIFQGTLGWTYAKAGRTGEARRLLEELKTAACKSYVPAISFAYIYDGLGEVDECFDWLNKAVDDRDLTALHMICHPGFESLRSHPRYKALLRKMNLEA
jgi:adenylate cyclase